MLTDDSCPRFQLRYNHVFVDWKKTVVDLRAMEDINRSVFVVRRDTPQERSNLRDMEIFNTCKRTGPLLS